MAATRPKTETIGFGFEPAGGAYHFVMTIPEDETTVTVAEHFVYGETVEDAASRARFSDVPLDYIVRPPRVKVALRFSHWMAVAEEVRAIFNRRLLGKELKKSAWIGGENLLAAHLGKELVLLLWAIEDANPADIPNALENWRGLEPEERWWLYTTINAATGDANEGRGRGWRRAIQIAFTENPVTENSSYFERNPLPASRNGHDSASLVSTRGGRRGKAKRGETDLSQQSIPLDLSAETTEP